MSIATTLNGDASAERIVRHFQSAGFPGITEALLIRIRLKKGDKPEVDAAFDLAMEREVAPPVHDYFEIRTYGFFSVIRTLPVAKAAFTVDFGRALRHALPDIYFEDAPVVVDDALATGTKYDAMLKLGNNVGDQAIAILLNDPNSSFFEYLDSNLGYDWQKIVGTLDAAVTSFNPDEELQ